MANLDKNGNPIALPKPEKKSKTKSQKPAKTVGSFVKDTLSPSPEALTHAALATNHIPEKLDRKQQNHINRNFGKSVEREVARLTGGTRVPMSGAVKNSVHNLEGDVTVPTPDGKRTLFLLECKGQSPKENAKSFQVKVPVLKQSQEEAELQKAFAAVWYHIKGEKYTEDWVMIPSEHFLRMLEMLREVYTITSMKENEE